VDGGSIPTEINGSKLKEWKTRLPKRLHLFLENFFGTCGGLDPEVNYFNYLRDLDLYGLDIRPYRIHRNELIEAFYAITGFRPHSG